MCADRLLDMVGQPGGPLADAALWDLEVVDAGPLTPNMHRVVLAAPGLGGLRYRAGQDLMLRVPQDAEGHINRRYTIRRLNPATQQVTIDASLHGTGPGTAWIQGARVGDHIEAIGPRGKVTLREEAEWHLFVGDETGLPGFLAMMEALPEGSSAAAFVEVDTPADEQWPENAQFERANLHWLHRLGRSQPGAVGPLSDAAADFEFPSGPGHVYVAAENKVVRAVVAALERRGLAAEHISGKAYWRADMANADHGEPARGD